MADKNTSTTVAAATANTTNVEQKATAAAPEDNAGQVVEEEDLGETKTYYLKPGARHNVIVKGENVELTEGGQPVKLMTSQYKSFKDKFLTADEYELVKKQAAEAAAEAEAERAAEAEAAAKEAKAREDAAKKTSAPPG